MVFFPNFAFWTQIFSQEKILCQLSDTSKIKGQFPPFVTTQLCTWFLVQKFVLPEMIFCSDVNGDQFNLDIVSQIFSRWNLYLPSNMWSLI